MYNNQDTKQVKWVPSSQIEAAHKQDWYPVLNANQKQAAEADSVKPSLSGNAAIMAAPLAVPAAVTGAIQSAVAPVADALPALYDLAVKHLAGNVLPEMETQAAKAKLLQMAPKVAQIVKEWALPTTSIAGLIKLLTMGDSKH
jgi:hypothetical protein